MRGSTSRHRARQASLASRVAAAKHRCGGIQQHAAAMCGLLKLPHATCDSHGGAWCSLVAAYLDSPHALAAKLKQRGRACTRACGTLLCARADLVICGGCLMRHGPCPSPSGAACAPQACARAPVCGQPNPQPELKGCAALKAARRIRRTLNYIHYRQRRPTANWAQFLASAAS